jgi:hypothetical protein
VDPNFFLTHRRVKYPSLFHIRSHHCDGALELTIASGTAVEGFETQIRNFDLIKSNCSHQICCDAHRALQNLAAKTEEDLEIE